MSETESRESLHSWQWIDPPEESAPVQFVLDTSLHGLKYIGQKQRHICERMFWMAAFIASLMAASTLIWEMWGEFISTPIVTVFNPTELTIAQIPFPAVTICSVNNIKKSKFKQYEAEALQGLRGQLPKEMMLRRLANILDINHICHSARSFTQKFYDPPIEQNEITEGLREYHSEYLNYSDTSSTLRNVSQSCEEMILFCVWLDGVQNCSKIFQQIETDYGYCCTFNTLPISLLRRFVRNSKDDPKMVQDWKDSHLENANILLTDGRQRTKYPFRQQYAGRAAGLSILIDPNIEEYHCIDTDSEGLLVGINLPLDIPRLKDIGVAVRTSTETFIGIRPDITLSTPTAKRAKLEKRSCYFDGERKLEHYTKYTTSNCVDECITNLTMEQCGCISYYMPHTKSRAGSHLCTPAKYGCPESVKEKIIRNGLPSSCGDCLPACTEIQFETQVTSLRIRDTKIIDLVKYHPNISMSDERARNVSIIHVYFNVDSIFPRLRKEASTTIELVSNAGGLLGLCMGFSMLSLLEVVYHFTLRLIFTIYRRHLQNETSKSPYPLVLSIKLDNSSKQAITNRPGYGDRIFVSRPPSNSRSDTGIPIYFRPPLESDFQRVYYETAWASSQSHRNRSSIRAS